MMIEPRKQVELRHVVEETPPTAVPGNAFCGTLKTGYLAIAKVMEGDAEVVKVLALSGQGLPAASATDVALCAMRSEEHTSELQSLMRISYAVFCLKKKKTPTKSTDKK